MSATSPELICEKANGIMRLTLNRPERRNALSDSLMEQLARAFEAAGADPEVRVIVLGATGDKAFCAGADLNPKAGTFQFDYAKPSSIYANMLRAARETPVPVIARVNGFCLAGGMGLLAVSDMAVAATSAKFGLPEVKIGLFPMQVAALLQSIVPARKFAEMCFTGEPFSAQEAFDYGLVNYVVPPEELDAKTDWLAARIADKSPTAIRRGKYALTAMEGMSAPQRIAYMESQVGLLPLTEDAKEGMTAFAEKRAPQWTGR